MPTPRLVIAALLLGAATTASAAGTAHAGKPADTDRQAAIAEEKDRLAREKREMEEREASLRKQLTTSEQLVAEKEAYLQQLRQQLKDAKAGK